MICEITVSDFKDFFDRGQFVYGTTVPSIRDKDITAAIAEASAVFNFDLYPTETVCKQALLYLTAHFLLLDTDASETGGAAHYNSLSHSADGISQSFSIPEWMTQGEYGFYTTTYYGQKWAALTKPYTDGAVYAVGGATTP